MKTKLHLLFFTILLTSGMYAQTLSVTSTLPSTIETDDALDFTVDYTTDSNSYNLIIRFYEDNDGTITRYGTAQSFTSVTANTTGTEILSINAPLVAATNYIARIFLEGPAPNYDKIYADDIPFTVTTKVVSVKDSYLFETDGESEGWLIGTTGGANPIATVSGGTMAINRGSGAWGTTYVQQSEFKLDPTIHTYVHITYKNLSKPNENNEIGLDWITSGTTRSTGANLSIETSDWSVPMENFTTVTYNLGADTEWINAGASTVADATNFRLYVREAAGSTKAGDLIIDSVIFNNNADGTLSTNNLSSNQGNLSVFPNPFKDSFSYKFDGQLSSAVNVELFSILGKKMEMNENNNTFNGNTGTINTKNLNKGIYIVRISSGNVNETRRLIKK